MNIEITLSAHNLDSDSKAELESFRAQVEAAVEVAYQDDAVYVSAGGVFGIDIDGDDIDGDIKADVTEIIGLVYDRMEWCAE